jgi:hypothetical protein
MDLNEVKYTDLNKQSKTKTVKDMQRAAHSQGYDMSDPNPVPHQGTHFKNKARKQRDRDPFTRKRTFEQFMYECNTLLTNTPQ